MALFGLHTPIFGPLHPIIGKLNGGTGLTSFTNTRVPFGNVDGGLSDSVNFTYVGSVLDLHGGNCVASIFKSNNYQNAAGTRSIIYNTGASKWYISNNLGIASNLEVAGKTSSGSAEIGDATNYTKIETDGTLEFNGTATVWKDINMGASQLSRPASSQPGLDTFVDENGADTGIETYAFAVGEKVHGSFEMQHDYKEGSDFTFHVHWQGITAPSGTDNVQWRLTYTLMRGGATLDAVTTIDTPDSTIDTQYMGVHSDFTAITGTNYVIGDQFLFTLERVASTGDAYAGDALITTAGIHYEIDTVGSRLIGTK